jgi:ring-1,2-phenylacetyl-CoA epoxidase subunit PaaD
VVTISLADLRSVVAGITDPEIPVLTIGDLGILRDLRLDGERVEVDITPTYSGCPALDTIRAEIESTLRRRGCAQVLVRTVLSPAWTTDWMSEAGRQALLEYGIAPPGPAGRPGPAPAAQLRALLPMAICCPQCGSARTEEISRFAATACRSLHRCLDCREPFDHFKAH